MYLSLPFKGKTHFDNLPRTCRRTLSMVRFILLFLFLIHIYVYVTIKQFSTNLSRIK